MQPAQNMTNAVSAYLGTDRRKSRRTDSNYPIRIRLMGPSGDMREHFSHTRNISPDGVMFAYSKTLSPGAEVDVAIAIPPTYSQFLPPSQLDAAAVVVRSEQVAGENDGFNVNVALRFIGTPKLSMNVSMFE
ncbi:PilZ domain-containing protein [Candidatus Poribacteria bacterium]|nr:PilZ domain-containing protein [Candidatus Poribacteria bacterium]